MEDEKIVNKLNWVIEEVKGELEERAKDAVKYDDLTPKLEKIIKNCETSVSLIKEYTETYWKRAATL